MFLENSVYPPHPRICRNFIKVPPPVTIRPRLGKPTSNPIGRTELGIVETGLVAPVCFARVGDGLSGRIYEERSTGPSRLVTPQSDGNFNNSTRSQSRVI